MVHRFVYYRGTVWVYLGYRGIRLGKIKLIYMLLRGISIRENKRRKNVKTNLENKLG